MVVSIMQPYFFPYLGYFQLMAASDVFVILDDVQYIKGGWVNRNRILVNQEPAWLIRPIVRASYTLPINRRSYLQDDVARRLLRKIEAAYRRAPHFADGYDVVAPLMQWPDDNVAAFNGHLLRELARLLGLKARIVTSSELDKDNALTGQDRVIEICRRLGATHYVNSIGGEELYDAASFAARGLTLQFLRPQTRPYAQFGGPHVPALSIIDALMFNDVEVVAQMCGDYRLESAGAEKVKRNLVDSGLFDAAYYAAANPDVLESGLDPLEHYIRSGDAEGRSPNEAFKPKLYRRRFMSGEPQGNALEHYALQGERAGADAGPRFRVADYFANHPELRGTVDRPLFHWLTVGRAQGLVGSNLPGAEWAQLFDRPLRRSLYELMQFKRALIEAFGIERGFAQFRDFLALPDMHGLKRKKLVSQRDDAKQRGLAYAESEAGGESHVIEPPRVIGTGNHRPLRFVSRSRYVACVSEVQVRGGSSLVERPDQMLFDYEGDELRNFDTEVDFDASVFAERGDEVWAITPDPAQQPIRVDEAFHLLGVRSIGFGHWIPEHLLKYAEARLSDQLPDVPVLIDEVMPPSHRRSLELLYPGVRIVVVPAFRTAHVDKLWFAPTPFFASLHERRNERFKWDFLNCTAERAAPALRDLGRRADLAVRKRSGPERIFFARKPGGHRQLVNHEAVESWATRAGFEKIYPGTLDFLEQLRLVRGARCIMAPEGSALFLAFFARPGTQVCVLTNAFTEGTVGYRPFFDAAGVDMTIVAGPTVRHDREFEEWSDYEIPEALFGKALQALGLTR